MMKILLLSYLISISLLALAGEVSSDAHPKSTSTSPSTSMSTGISGINYEITKESKKDQYVDVSTQSLKFSGADLKIVAQLNKIVHKLWSEESGCDTSDVTAADMEGGRGDFSRDLLFVKLTRDYLILNDQGNFNCPRSPHPGSWYKQIIIDIKTSEILDVAKLLSPAEKKYFAKLVSENGKKIRTDEGCADVYDLEEIENTLLLFSLKANSFIVEPELAHVVQACTEELNIPISKFKTIVQKNEKLLEILKNF